MVDSHVLVGSCAQVGARVHLSAGVLIGGVLEPGARPVIVEDDAFVGRGLPPAGRRARGAGRGPRGRGHPDRHVRLYDLVGERVLAGHARCAALRAAAARSWSPGRARSPASSPRQHGLAAQAAMIVKDRDARTDARVALEEALR